MLSILDHSKIYGLVKSQCSHYSAGGKIVPSTGYPFPKQALVFMCLQYEPL